MHSSWVTAGLVHAVHRVQGQGFMLCVSSMQDQGLLGVGPCHGVACRMFRGDAVPFSDYGASRTRMCSRLQ